MRIQDYEDIPDEAWEALKEANAEKLEQIFDNALRVLAIMQQRLNRTSVMLTTKDGGIVVASILSAGGEKKSRVRIH